MKAGDRNSERAPLFPLVFHKGKINSIYKLQLHSLLLMPSMYSVSSHDPWSMGNASFESHVTTSSRNLPKTRASFQHSRYVQSFHLFYSAHLHLVTLKVRVGCCSLVYSRVKSPYVSFVLVVHKEVSQHYFTLLFWVCWHWFRMACLLYISHCVYCKLYLVDVFVAATRLISSKKSVYDPMGTYSIGSTKQAVFINEPYNKTAAAQCQWHGETVVCSKKNCVEQSGKGKEFSVVPACKCTYTSFIRIWKASAWLYYYWLHVKDVIDCITLYCLKGEACSLVL